MIDRDFEQVSEEHMKAMTKPEGPAQEPQRTCSRCYAVHPGVSCYWHAHGKTPADKTPGGRTFELSSGQAGCAECCNGDRCDDATHHDRDSCPYCLGSGKPVPATPAPSQPAGAREWLERYHGDLSRLEWPQQFPLSVLIEYLEAYAAQQTAAKDAELAWLRKERQRHLVELEAAERERDSLREALEQIAQVAASDGHIKLLSVWRIADAALKAGKK